MNLELIRETRTARSISGRFKIDGQHECWSLESAARAIPEGRYEVTITHSPRFKRLMPLINVPHRIGIRIHPANWPEELEGCIAPGETRAPDCVGSSRIAFAHLFRKIESALRESKCLITIKSEEKSNVEIVA